MSALTENTTEKSYPPFIAIGVLSLLLCYLASSMPVIGNNALMHITIWLVITLLSLCACLFFPRAGNRTSFLIIILTGIAARLLFLPLQESDDVYRYLWEGRIPTDIAYQYPPQSSYFVTHQDLTSAEISAIRQKVNHPDLTACYPPLFLLVCGLVQKASFNPMSFKVFSLLCDLGVLAVLVMILRQKLLPLRLAMLYAFCPLALYAYAGNGHYDPFMTLNILLAIYAFNRRSFRSAFIFLALAVLIKYIAILGLPFFITRENRKYLSYFALTFLALMLPYLYSLQEKIFDSLYSFGADMSFNSPLHALILSITGNTQAASFFCGALLLAGIIYIIKKLHPLSKSYPTFDPACGFLAALGLLLLLSPTLHFWYWGWLIPLAIIRRNWFWLIPSLTSAFYLTVFDNLQISGEWKLPLWAQIAEWLPFALAFIPTGYMYLKKRRIVPTTVPENFSVIIPVKGNEDGLESTLSALKSSCCVNEIIIVGNCADAKLQQIARNHAAVFHIHDKPIDEGGGRGGQIARGVRHAVNDWIIVLHADVICRPDSIFKLKKFLQHNPEVCGGALGGRFDKPDNQAIEALNNLRGEFFSITFGDQIQFFNKPALTKTGGFPEYPLMEDIELSVRLWQCGKSAFLWQPNIISARKWQGNRLKRSLGIIGLCLDFLLHRLWGAVDTTAMYHQYYHTRPASSANTSEKS